MANKKKKSVYSVLPKSYLKTQEPQKILDQILFLALCDPFTEEPKNIIKMAIEMGANIETTFACNGLNIIEIAFMRKDVEFVSWLKSKGARMNVESLPKIIALMGPEECMAMTESF